LDIKKAVPSPQAPADQPTGAKAPTQKKGQATRKQVTRQPSSAQVSPETQVLTPNESHHPMATRTRTKQQEASRAGGLRPGVGGSGQTEIGVNPVGSPSKT
jgi:hypothetical protein